MLSPLLPPPTPRVCSTSANDEEDDLSKADGEGEAEAETEAAPPLRRPETPAALGAGDASDTAGETESEAEVSCCCCHRSSGEQAATSDYILAEFYLSSSLKLAKLPLLRSSFCSL